MSLFVCEDCGTIDNSNSMNNYDNGMERSPKYPNMRRMEMDGFGGTSLERGPTRYLCSECNTGYWHAEWDRRIAEAAEKDIVKYTGSQFVTPTVHPMGSLERDTDSYCGYVVNPIFKLMVDQVVAYYETLGITYKVSELYRKHPLYTIWCEDMKNFNAHCLDGLDMSDNRSVELSILDSQFYNGPNDVAGVVSNSSRSKLYDTYYKYFIRTNSSLDDFKFTGPMDYTQVEMVMGNFKRKLYSRETQSIEDKEEALFKAEAKRNVKNLKRLLNNSTELDDVGKAAITETIFNIKESVKERYG